MGDFELHHMHINIVITLLSAAFLTGCLPRPPVSIGPDFCRADTQAACETIANCEWQFKGGRITPHYLCCPSDKAQWPYRCTIIVD